MGVSGNTSETVPEVVSEVRGPQLLQHSQDLNQIDGWLSSQESKEIYYRHRPYLSMGVAYLI
jgi:hypothetical protein